LLVIPPLPNTGAALVLPPALHPAQSGSAASATRDALHTGNAENKETSLCFTVPPRNSRCDSKELTDRSGTMTDVALARHANCANDADPCGQRRGRQRPLGLLGAHGFVEAYFQALQAPRWPRLGRSIIVLATMQSKLDKASLVAAAVSGLIFGAQCKGASPTSSEAHAATPAGSAAGPHKGDKACCKGKNDCKGKGGCSVAGKHDCAGKNDCKGQGGCDMHCPS
jgi:hypothetical protein